MHQPIDWELIAPLDYYKEEPFEPFFFNIIEDEFIITYLIKYSYPQSCIIF